MEAAVVGPPRSVERRAATADGRTPARPRKSRCRCPIFCTKRCTARRSFFSWKVRAGGDDSHRPPARSYVELLLPSHGKGRAGRLFAALPGCHYGHGGGVTPQIAQLAHPLLVLVVLQMPLPVACAVSVAVHWFAVLGKIIPLYVQQLPGARD